VRDQARYRKLFPRIWRHPGFRALKPAARELALYLLTGPQTNGIGLFHFSPATAAEDLNVGGETLRERLADVSTTFGWLFDADARVFYIPSWWRWNKPENENVLKGILKVLNEIPPSSLVEAFAANLETLPETFHQTFLECCRQRLVKRPVHQEQYQEHLSGDRNTLSRANGTPWPSKEKTAGEEGNDLLPVAHAAVKAIGSDADIDQLLDHFAYMLRPKSVPRATAIVALNKALWEYRQAVRA
jgi:hypothetical protein